MYEDLLVGMIVQGSLNVCIKSKICNKHFQEMSEMLKICNNTFLKKNVTHLVQIEDLYGMIHFLLTNLLTSP